MYKHDNIQEAAKAHLNTIKPYFHPENWPEDVDIDNLPNNIIDLIVAIDKIYATEIGENSVFADQIPEWDADSITLPDAFYHLLMTMASRSWTEVQL